MGRRPESNASLDAALLKGIAWTSAANGIAQVLTWASTLLVARLLVPADYGLVAMAAVYLGLAALLSEFGLGAAVITLRDLTSEQIEQLNALAVLFAVAAVAVSWLVAAPLGRFFSSPRIPLVVGVMSSAFLITGLRTVSYALLERELRFKFLAVAQTIQALTSAGLALTLALSNAGYWALVAGPLGGQVVMTVLVMLKQPCGLVWPRWSTLGPALTFSRRIIVGSLAWYGYTAADKLIIGRLLGQVALGFYSFAASFGLMAVEKVTVLVLRVAPGIFSAVQNDAAELRRYLLRLTEGLSIVTFPVSIGLALVADDLVMVAVGAKWAGAIAPLRILGVFGAVQSLTPLLPRVLNVVGETRLAMRASLLALVALPLSFLIGANWGVSGVAFAWLLVFPLTQIPLYLRLRDRIGLHAGEYLRAVWPAGSSVVLMAAGVVALDYSPWFASLAATIHLAAQVVIGAAIYAVALLLLHRRRLELIGRIVGEIRSAGSSGSREAPAEAAS